MGRRARVDYPGAFHHVTMRGTARQPIFADDLDRTVFLELLGAAAERGQWRVHAWCLMGNHYHLMLDTPQGLLSRGMHVLNGRYARHFTRRHDRPGHLYQGRFHNEPLLRDAHGLEVIRYIFLNPVRAGLVARARDWRWSSYRALVGLSPSPVFLDSSWILAQFGADVGAARRALSRFVAAGVGQPPPERDSGAHEVLERLAVEAPPFRTLEWYVAEFHDRDTAIRAAWGSGHHSQAAIGRHFGISGPRVSQIVGQYGKG